ncbi:MAG: L-seryl-tRNA(Sec) selenium transferase [Candidatus Hydrogenedentota bacterium]|nr:MAG: L-seryl-tRNA(Sec) selenium transferase [Candidatus Hydrogenedentota bacterium]
MRLPKMDALLASKEAALLLDTYSRTLVKRAVQEEIETLRANIFHPTADTLEPIVHWDSIRARLESYLAPSLRRVINGTGIILHTNLGRAPLANSALQAIHDTASGYSNLELNLESGKRGSRYDHVESILKELTGAEAALVVNNNAAAVMLAVNTLAKDGEVVTSRGELIEIGGSFRIPEVVERSEADLVEVGTTNKTRVGDFRNALSDKTRMLLKVHPSNFKVVGFTEEASREELVALAKEKNILMVEDLGSGSLIDLSNYGLPGEPTVSQVIKSGVDIVTFSGDKLLGGPQAGLILGRADLLDTMKRNPLLRALRMDKLTLAALESTLRLYLNEDTLTQTVPILFMLSTDIEDIQRLAEQLVSELKSLSGITATIVEDNAYSGGGALPDETLPSCAVALHSENFSPDALAEALRTGDPAVVGRISDGSFLLNARTLFQQDLPLIVERLRQLHP